MKYRLFSFELSKLMAARFLWVLLAILLVANGILCTVYAPVDPHMEAYEAGYAAVCADPEQTDTYRHRLEDKLSRDMLLQFEAFQRGEVYTPEPEPVTFDPEGLISDLEVLSYVRANTPAAHKELQYRTRIEAVILSAEQNERDLVQTMGVDADSYTCRYQRRVIHEYSALWDSKTQTGTVVLRDGIDKGWDTLFLFEPTNLIILLVAVLGTVSVFAAEGNGGSVLLRAGKRGRGETAAVKLAVALLFGAVCVLLCMGSTAVAVALKVGFSDPRQAIQAFPDFILVPYAWTVLEYLGFFLLAKLLSVSLLILLTACVMIAAGRAPVAFTAGALLGVGGYVLYHYAEKTLAGQLNPYTYMLYVPLTRRFWSRSCGGHVLETITVCRVLFAVLLLLAFAGGVMLFAKRYPLGQRKSLHLPTRLRQAVAGHLAAVPKLRRKRDSRMHGLLFYEWFKQAFTVRFAVLLLLVVSLQTLLTVSQVQTSKSFAVAVYKDYMNTTVGGEQTPEKSAWIAEEYRFITETVEKKEEVFARYMSGEMPFEDYQVFLDDLNYAEGHLVPIERIYAHDEYLTEITDRNGIRGEFLFEDDWLTYFRIGVDWLLLLLILLAVSGTFADEYNAERGKDAVRSLIRSTKRGRRDTFRAKVIFALSLSALLAVCFTALETVLCLRQLELGNYGYKLLSVELFGMTDCDLTLGAFAVLRLILRFVGMLFVSAIALALGELLRKKIYALCVAGLLVVLPWVCDTFGVPFVKYISLAGMLDGTMLWRISSALGRHDALFLVLFTVAYLGLTVALLLAARRRYMGKHRKRGTSV